MIHKRAPSTRFTRSIKWRRMAAKIKKKNYWRRQTAAGENKKTLETHVNSSRSAQEENHLASNYFLTSGKIIYEHVLGQWRRSLGAKFNRVEIKVWFKAKEIRNSHQKMNKLEIAWKVFQCKPSQCYGGKCYWILRNFASGKPVDSQRSWDF